MKNFKENTSINNLINETLNNIKILTNNSSIFGEPSILPDGTIIIPVSKLTVGFVVGGGEYSDLSNRRVGVHYPMAGGSGGGISSTPVGFIVSTEKEIKFVPTANAAIMEQFLDKAEKFASFIKKKLEKEWKDGKQKIFIFLHICPSCFINC